MLGLELAWDSACSGSQGVWSKFDLDLRLEPSGGAGVPGQRGRFQSRPAVRGPDLAWSQGSEGRVPCSEPDKDGEPARSGDRVRTRLS